MGDVCNVVGTVATFVAVVECTVVIVCGWVANPGVVGTVTDEGDVASATVVVTCEVVVVAVVDGNDAGGLIAVWLPLFTV